MQPTIKHSDAHDEAIDAEGDMPSLNVLYKIQKDESVCSINQLKTP